VQISVMQMSFSNVSCPGILNFIKGSNKVITVRPVKMGSIGCPETSVNHHQHTLRRMLEGPT
jgi:hypothetical protein